MSTQGITRRSASAAIALTAASWFGVPSLARAEALPDIIRFGGFGQGFGKPHGVALLAIAQSRGFIADEFKGTPVKFTYEYFTGTGPAINEAIANGQLDFAQYGALPNIVGRAAGLPTRILTSYGYSNTFGVARAGLPIKSFADLKGHRVAVTKGTVIHWALLKALQGSGLRVQDITLVDLKAADQFAALAAGSVDAALGTNSILPLRDQGVVKVFYTSKDIGYKAAGFGSITVTESFERKYPEATARVTRGLVRAAEWLSHEENREEALRIWSLSGVSVAALREDFDGQSLRDAFNPHVDAFFIAQYRDAAAFSKEQKLIRQEFDVDAWFLPAYVDRALSELKLTRLWPRRSADGTPIGI